MAYCDRSSGELNRVDPMNLVKQGNGINGADFKFIESRAELSHFFFIFWEHKRTRFVNKKVTLKIIFDKIINLKK